MTQNSKPDKLYSLQEVDQIASGEGSLGQLVTSQLAKQLADIMRENERLRNYISDAIRYFEGDMPQSAYEILQQSNKPTEPTKEQLCQLADNNAFIELIKRSKTSG